MLTIGLVICSSPHVSCSRRLTYSVFPVAWEITLHDLCCCCPLVSSFCCTGAGVGIVLLQLEPNASHLPHWHRGTELLFVIIVCPSISFLIPLPLPTPPLLSIKSPLKYSGVSVFESHCNLKAQSCSCVTAIKLLCHIYDILITFPVTISSQENL